MLQKAVCRAADKDRSGTLLCSPPDESFMPLAKVPDSHLFAIAAECGLVFPSSSLVPPVEVLSLIRAKELAQENLAKVAAKAAAAIEQAHIEGVAGTSAVPASPNISAALQLKEAELPSQTQKKAKPAPLFREKPVLRATPAHLARTTNPVIQ